MLYIFVSIKKQRRKRRRNLTKSFPCSRLDISTENKISFFNMRHRCGNAKSLEATIVCLLCRCSCLWHDLKRGHQGSPGVFITYYLCFDLFFYFFYFSWVGYYIVFPHNWKNACLVFLEFHLWNFIVFVFQAKREAGYVWGNRKTRPVLQERRDRKISREETKTFGASSK